MKTFHSCEWGFWFRSRVNYWAMALDNVITRKSNMVNFSTCRTLISQSFLVSVLFHLFGWLCLLFSLILFSCVVKWINFFLFLSLSFFLSFNWGRDFYLETSLVGRTVSHSSSLFFHVKVKMNPRWRPRK